MTTEVTQKSENEFYSDAANYWSEIPATVDGMLGGFGFISQTDIKGSKMLLKQLFNARNPPGRQYALDCGAGIGRISKFLLTDLFDNVDLVEQNPLFLEKAKNYMGSKILKIGSFYPTGLQNFHPESMKYDIIWIQWVLGHLTDNDLINFLISCQDGLKHNGMIIVKENVTSSDDIEMDRQDSSVTRPMWLLRRIFDKANLMCYRQIKQHNFPKGLYSVYMFVLKPQKSDENIIDIINTSSVLTDLVTSNTLENKISDSADSNTHNPQKYQNNKNTENHNEEKFVLNNLEDSKIIKAEQF